MDRSSVPETGSMIHPLSPHHHTTFFIQRTIHARREGGSPSQKSVGADTGISELTLAKAPSLRTVHDRCCGRCALGVADGAQPMQGTQRLVKPTGHPASRSGASCERSISSCDRASCCSVFRHRTLRAPGVGEQACASDLTLCNSCPGMQALCYIRPRQRCSDGALRGLEPPRSQPEHSTHRPEHSPGRTRNILVC